MTCIDTLFSSYKKYLLLTGLCLAAITIPLHTMESPDTHYWEDSNDDLAEDFDIDVLNLPDAQPGRACSNLTPEEKADCVTFITDPDDGVNGIPILKEPLYLRTHPLNVRNVLDLPVFQLFEQHMQDSVFKMDLFYNHTHRVRFDEESTDIRAYIALEEPNLIRAINDAQESIGELLPLNIPPILKLFSRLTIQQRRAGAMFFLGKVIDKMRVSIKMPLIYTQRNFFFEQEDINRLNRSSISWLYFDPTAPLSDFTKKHLIADRIGMGDARVQLGYRTVDHRAWRTYMGTEFTFPTHFAFKRGLMGNKFYKENLKPCFDLCRLIVLAPQSEELREQVVDEATCFLIGALDQLSSNLLDDPDGRHLGLALFSESEITLAEWVSLHSRSVFQYRIPSYAKRFFIRKRNSKEFDLYDFEDEDDADKNLEFIDTQFMNKLYPDVVSTRVSPGFLINFTSRIDLHKDHWSLTFGSDWWWQQEESLKFPRVPVEILDRLDIDKGIRPEAYQSKLFGGIIYTRDTPTHDWRLSLMFDVSTTCTSIGRDFTISLGFEDSF